MSSINAGGGDRYCGVSGDLDSYPAVQVFILINYLIGHDVQLFQYTHIQYD